MCVCGGGGGGEGEGGLGKGSVRTACNVLVKVRKF